MINDDLDEEDTAPVLSRDSAYVVSEVLDIGPGERGELVLIPERPIRHPFLFMSNSMKGSRVIVEQVRHGNVELAGKSDQNISEFRLGSKLDLTVTSNEPIKIVVMNQGSLKTTVGASLVAGEKKE